MRGALALLAAAPAPARAAAAASPATCSALLLEPAAGQASAQQPPQSTTQPPAQQAPAGPSARPAQTAPGSPEAQAPRGTAAGTVEGTPVEERDPGEVRVRAESYEQVAKGQVQARGFVDLDVGGIRIQADKADIFEVPQPDGKLGHKIIAEGNVVFIRGEERMSGDRLEMDDSGKGYLLNAVGYVEPGVWVEGKRVDRLDDRTYKVTGGRFTSCNQPNPRWGFQ